MICCDYYIFLFYLFFFNTERAFFILLLTAEASKYSFISYLLIKILIFHQLCRVPIPTSSVAHKPLVLTKCFDKHGKVTIFLLVSHLFLF